MAKSRTPSLAFVAPTASKLNSSLDSFVMPGDRMS